MKLFISIKPTLTAAAAIIVFLLSAAPSGFAENASAVIPKQRIEREFRQLEITLTRFMYNSVMNAPDIESMNRNMRAFMRENPGVVRILRTNAAGITVSDISSDSPNPEPPRNISAQKWLQYVTQNHKPYYGMDYDTASGVTLFYAWPLMTGPDLSRFSGTFAAMIDFTTHAALIDDAAPFQIAYRDRAFFQHEWEDADYDEEILEIKGARYLTVRTEQPLPTRQSQQLRKRASAAEAETTPKEHENESESEPKEKTGKSKAAAPTIPVRTVVYVVLVIIALVFAYKFLLNRLGQSEYLVAEESPTPLPNYLNRGAAKPAAEQPAQPIAGPAPNQTQQAPPAPAQAPNQTQRIALPQQQHQQMPLTQPMQQPAQQQMPQPAAAAAANNAGQQNIDSIREQQKSMSKMLKLIKEEFTIMDKKIHALVQRIEALEKRKG